MILYDNFVHVLAGVAAVLLILNALCEHIPFEELGQTANESKQRSSRVVAAQTSRNIA